MGDTIFPSQQAFPALNDKARIRALMRARRQAVSAGGARGASRRICRHVANHPYFLRARRIALYFPMDGEIDLIPLVATFPHKQFYLPVLPPRGRRRLWFARYTGNAGLVRDRFGIPTPVTRVRRRAETLDLILAPLVAFDAAGGRIGMGGGFYDESLEFLRRGSGRAVRVVGAAHHFQQIDDIPRERWDIPLHGVITDHGYIPARA